MSNASLTKAVAYAKSNPLQAQDLGTVLLTGIYRVDFISALRGVEVGNTYRTLFPFDGEEWELTLTKKRSK